MTSHFTCTTDGSNGPCNHDNKSDIDALYDSDDSYMSSSGDSSWSCTLSGDCWWAGQRYWQCGWFNGACIRDFVPAGVRTCLGVGDCGAETKVHQCNKQYNCCIPGQSTFAKIGELFYWFQKLCDYYKKSLVSGKTLDGVNQLKCPSSQFHDYFYS